MTNTTHAFHITELRALPQVEGLADVIAVVAWQVVFARDGQQSFGGGETRLNPPDGSNFTPITQVTEQQVIDWVVAKEGGDEFLQMLYGVHDPVLADLCAKAQTKVVNLSFVQSTCDINPPQNIVIDPVLI